MNFPLSGLSSIALQVQSIIKPTKAPFANKEMGGMGGMGGMDASQGVIFLVILMLLLYLTMLIGSYIFNTSVVKIFPSTKSVTTLDFFGLYIVLHILLC
jgi:hypothetical protein